MTEEERKREEEKQRELLAGLALAHAAMWRLWKRGTVAPAQKIHNEALGRLFVGLRGVLGASSQKIVSPVVMGQAQQYLRNFIAPLSSRLGDVMTAVTAQVPVEAAMGVDRMISKLTGQNVHLADRARLARLELSKRAQEATLRAQMVAALEQDINQSILVRLSKIPRDAAKVADIIAEAGLGLDDSWWKIERVVRTRTADIFNEAQADAIGELSVQFPSIQMRWTELVDEVTGAPLDRRVGRDSLALHGQLTPPGHLFTMPEDPRAPPKMVGQSWIHPPNRANDRAVCAPWMPGWNVPVYRVRGTSRVPVNYRTGAPSAKVSERG